MGDITILIIFVLSICYLAYKVLNDQRNEDEAERQALTVDEGDLVQVIVIPVNPKNN